MFQCTLSVLVNGCALVLPAGILSIEAPQATGTPETGPCVVLSIPEVQLQLRLHDFFFGERAFHSHSAIRTLTIPSEMSYNIPTIDGHIDYNFPRRLSYERTKRGQKIMMIDGESGR
jgi:hypothetical protein